MRCSVLVSDIFRSGGVDATRWRSGASMGGCRARGSALGGKAMSAPPISTRDAPHTPARTHGRRRWPSSRGESDGAHPAPVPAAPKTERPQINWGLSLVSEGGLEPPRPIKGTSTSS